MKTVWAILAIMMLVSFCSCGEKKQAAQEQTVRVKVQQIQTEVVNGEQGFSGTIEEQSGVLMPMQACRPRCWSVVRQRDRIRS